MAETAPTRTPLGAATLNRNTYVDVAEVPASGGTITWLPLMGITEYKPKYGEQTTQDSSDFDGGGFKDQDVTALGHGGEGKLVRKTLGSDPTKYDPGQELVRKRSLLQGVQARFMYRQYEMEPGGPRSEALTGYCTASTDWDGGGMDALKAVSFTITGKGAPTSTTHPFPSA